jgi:hypothetical protein
MISALSGTGVIVLPVRPTQAGHYSLNITVTYADAKLATQTFNQVGDGVYVFGVTFALRQETASIPYTVLINVSGSDVGSVTNSFAIFPS